MDVIQESWNGADELETEILALELLFQQPVNSVSEAGMPDYI